MTLISNQCRRGYGGKPGATAALVLKAPCVKSAPTLVQEKVLNGVGAVLTLRAGPSRMLPGLGLRRVFPLHQPCGWGTQAG